MLTYRDEDKGIVHVLHGGKIVKGFPYDIDDRAGQKAAHQRARDYLEGARYVTARLGLSEAGDQVFNGRAA